MRKTWLVARHEFSVTLGRLAYRIFAASVPVLAIVALIGIAIFQAVSSDDTSQEDTSTTPPEAVTFGYVDLTTGRGRTAALHRFPGAGQHNLHAVRRPGDGHARAS